MDIVSAFSHDRSEYCKRIQSEWLLTIIICAYILSYWYKFFDIIPPHTHSATMFDSFNLIYYAILLLNLLCSIPIFFQLEIGTFGFSRPIIIYDCFAFHSLIAHKTSFYRIVFVGFQLPISEFKNPNLPYTSYILDSFILLLWHFYAKMRAIHRFINNFFLFSIHFIGDD